MLSCKYSVIILHYYYTLTLQRAQIMCINNEISSQRYS